MSEMALIKCLDLYTYFVITVQGLSTYGSTGATLPASFQASIP